MSEPPSSRNISTKPPTVQALSAGSNQATKTSRAFPRKPAVLDRLLTLRDAERLYGVSEWVIYRAVAMGKIRAVRRGDEGRVYYLESEIKQLINQPCVTPLLAA